MRLQCWKSFLQEFKKSISRSFKNWCFLNIFPKTYPLFWVRICKAIRNILKEPNILPPIFPQVSDFQDFYLKWVYFYSLVQIWHFEQEALLTDCSSWTCNNGKASPTPTRLLPKQRYWYKQYFFRFNKGISATAWHTKTKINLAVLGTINALNMWLQTWVSRELSSWELSNESY